MMFTGFFVLLRPAIFRDNRSLAKGVDPMAQRKAEKTAEMIAVENSFQSVATKWIEHWRHGKSPRHVAYLERRMEADVFPCLGARPIEQIEAL
jgi:hypothetical protein